MGRGKLVRRIVVEYTMNEKRDRIRGDRSLHPQPKRIISWTQGKDNRMDWKVITCPQNTFYGIKGYYNTLGIPVLFYNVGKNQWHKDLPKSVNL